MNRKSMLKIGITTLWLAVLRQPSRGGFERISRDLC